MINWQNPLWGGKSRLTADKSLECASLIMKDEWRIKSDYMW